MMRARIEPLSTAEKPTPRQFGLPSAFSLHNYVREQEKLALRQKDFANWATAWASLATLIIGYGYFQLNDPKNTPLLWLAASPIGAIAVGIYLTAFKKLSQFVVKSEAWELAFGESAETYLLAHRDWEFTQTEAGFGYWRDLKSIKFEHAVARFFNRRHCEALLTKSTGDGGVDIILNVGGITYWCQCKGLAKPVSVAEVRRIAGACLKSRGVAKPALFATNGFTKPALLEANDLGVKCIDGIMLSQLANRPTIRSL